MGYMKQFLPETIDEYGFDIETGEYADTWFDEDELTQEGIKKLQKPEPLTRKLNETTSITENKINKIKEDLNEYLTTKQLEKEGWEVYRTVNVIESPTCKGIYEHKVNPLVLEAIKRIKKKGKLHKILKDFHGLPDLTAIKVETKEIKFVELKGFKFPIPTETQQKKFKEIETNGFTVEIIKRKFKIDIALEQEEKTSGV